MAVTPLELPASFDESVQMPVTETDHGRYHVTRDAARLAHRLCANGTEVDIRRAGQVLEALLGCQETDEKDPHVGNFYWMREDGVVTDLNAVAFVLEHLIPLLMSYRDRVDRIDEGRLSVRLLESIRAGLEEVARLDVHVAYTNIALFDVHNSWLGGRLLGDSRMQRRAEAKLERWVAFTNRSGHPFEYNSPTYTPIALRLLEGLADHAASSDFGILAETMAARIALSIALHLHGPTQRWAGPHGRAYHPAVQEGFTEREQEMMSAVRSGRYTWLRGAFPNQEGERTVVDETSSCDRDMAMTTFKSDSFSLGTASTTFGGQSNVVIAYYDGHAVRDADASAGDERAGVLFTRYLTDDKWLGDFYHATDRSNLRNLIDEGEFHGVQSGSSMIGAYAPPRLAGRSGAKAVLVWSNAAAFEEIRVGGEAVERFPATIPPGEALFMKTRGTFFAVLPLTRIALGAALPTELCVRDGQLVLELVQYRGPRKDFWELRQPGPFFQGRPLNAFYLEMAESGDYRDLEQFADKVLAGQSSVHLDPPRTIGGLDSEQRIWRAEYGRADRRLGLEIDLFSWRLLRRWNEKGDKGWPMLSATCAREVGMQEEGAEAEPVRVEVADACLTSGIAPAWLYGDVERQLWVAGVRGVEGSAREVVLETPKGSIRVPQMNSGLIKCDGGDFMIRATGLTEKPEVTGAHEDME